MRILEGIQQGSQEWLDIRARYRCASDAPIVMGASSKMKRNELLYSMKTLSPREFSDWVMKNILEWGHEVEAAIRPTIEAREGDELYPVTAVDDADTYLASFDGMPMSEAFHWECKQWNEKLVEMVSKGELDPEWYWQLEHQLLVDKAPKCLFTVSDGTREVSMWYSAVPGRREELIRGWDQFMLDLEAYVPVEAPALIAAKPVTDLPAVLVQVKGQIDITDNFKLFETALKDFIENRLIREPKTDQDFADLELQVKALKKAEDALNSAESMMLAQVSAIDAAKRQKDMLHELARSNRLLAEKLVKVEKENRRNQIVRGGQDSWASHVDQINRTLGGKIILPGIPVNFAGVVKGLKTISSMQNSVDTELARVKIEANRVADGIRINLTSLRELSAGYEFLFTDAQQLALKDNESLCSIVKGRVSEHKEQERKKEEQIRIKAEADARAKLEREQQEERERLAPLPETKRAELVSEPLPAASLPASKPAAPITGNRTPGAVRRPPDTEIVDTLAAHYKVNRGTVIGWLKNFNSELAA